MGCDGAFLYLLRAELETAVGGFVDKVLQPYRDQIILKIRTRDSEKRLTFITRPDAARVHFTTFSYPNPAQPPMLCMLLRKLLCGSRLVSVTQEETERVLRFQFSGRGELGQPREITAIAEIIGRSANLIFTDPDGVIIDAVKRVPEGTGSSRPMYPGAVYRPLPPLEKLPLLGSDSGRAAQMIAGCGDMPLDKAILRTLAGLCPATCAEIAHRVSAEPVAAGQLGAEGTEKLSSVLSAVKSMLESGGCIPSAAYAEDGTGIEFSFFPLSGIPGCRTRRYPSLSALLDEFYYNSELAERRRQRTRALRKRVTALREREIRKLANREAEAAESEDAGRWRDYGDLITANMHLIKKGDTELRALRFDGSGEAVVPLRPELSGAQNARYCYKEYRKRKTAARELKTLTARGREQISYLDTVLYSLENACGDAEVEQITAELTAQGLLRPDSRKKNAPKPAPARPYRFVSASGFTILVGKNNRQNDSLTFREAAKTDIWLHARGVPGSHVIIRAGGAEPDEATLGQAAALAALYSSAAEGGKTAVDYTEVRNVRKPPGSKPGFVTYTDYRTVTAEPRDARGMRALEDAERGQG